MAFGLIGSASAAVKCNPRQDNAFNSFVSDGVEAIGCTRTIASKGPANCSLVLTGSVVASMSFGMVLKSGIDQHDGGNVITSDAGSFEGNRARLLTGGCSNSGINVQCVACRCL